MRIRIYVDASLCTGCRICEFVCYFSKTGKFNPKKARIHVLKDLKRGIDLPLLCRHCNNPPCVRVCPEGALFKDNTEGLIRVLDEACKGCGLCVKECIVNALRLDPRTRKPLICDMCGGKPKCASWCPTGAISLVIANPESVTIS